MNEFRKIHQYNCFSCDSPKQVALAEFLQHREHYVELGSFLQKKRDYFQELMKEKLFKPLQSHGSYFQIYSYSDLSNENEKDFAIRLTKEYGVATIPVSALYQDEVKHKVVRFCFAKKEETLERAVKQLKTVKPLL